MNRLKGEVEVDLPGMGKRQACLNMNAMLEIQQVLGLESFDEIVTRLSQRYGDEQGGRRRHDYAMVRAVLWASMREYDQSLTIEEVGRHITWSTLARALLEVAKILEATMDLEGMLGPTVAAAETPNQAVEPEAAA
jgi:hypothetical protein